MIHNVTEESADLLHEVSDLAEAFITKRKRGKSAASRNGDASLSSAAALDMVDVMTRILRLFQSLESEPRSATMQLLKAGCPAPAVASQQVSRLLLLVGRTSDTLLRAQFATLLLVNVTRRILSILRECAANNKATTVELEAEAQTLLNRLDSEEEEEEEAAEEDESNACSINGNDSAVADDVAMAIQRKTSLSLSRASDFTFSPTRREGSGDAQLPRRRGLCVRFAGFTDKESAASSTPLGPQATSTSALNVLGGPLLQRTGSIVGTEIPGRQLLKRAPSLRSQMIDETDEVEFPVRMESFYDDALDAIDEFRKELEGMSEELCSRAPRQLHSSDTILTVGYSHTVSRYLINAAEAGHRFKVFILEGAPLPAELTRQFADELRLRSINAQLLPDSSAYVVMSNCTKVLVGAENVLANGGMLASIGTHVLCAAARHFAVPVLVVTTTMKMSPYYPSDKLCTRLVRIARSGAQEMPWCTYGPPDAVWSAPFGGPVGEGGLPSLSIHAPITEYVPPELIALFVTNDGELLPSQIHRVVRANYSEAD